MLLQLLKEKSERIELLSSQVCVLEEHLQVYLSHMVCSIQQLHRIVLLTNMLSLLYHQMQQDDSLESTRWTHLREQVKSYFLVG